MHRRLRSPRNLQRFQVSSKNNQRAQYLSFGRLNNVDANYDNVKIFFGMNTDDLNLNYAIGEEEDSFITLHINKVPSLTTASQDVIEGRGGFNK